MHWLSPSTGARLCAACEVRARLRLSRRLLSRRSRVWASGRLSAVSWLRSLQAGCRARSARRRRRGREPVDAALHPGRRADRGALTLGASWAPAVVRRERVRRERVRRERVRRERVRRERAPRTTVSVLAGRGRDAAGRRRSRSRSARASGASPLPPPGAAYAWGWEGESGPAPGRGGGRAARAQRAIAAATAAAISR